MTCPFFVKFSNEQIFKNLRMKLIGCPLSTSLLFYKTDVGHVIVKLFYETDKGHLIAIS